MTEQDKSTKSLAATGRVFISYSHDSPEHQERVLALAERLRKDGIEAWIDQYVQDPNEGWIRWMRSQVKQADRVLLVLTKPYQRRFEGDEEEGTGLGATFEGVIVTQTLYESGGRNAKFRPVVFRQEDEQFIPLELRQFNRYRLDTEQNYKELLRWLHEAPRIVAPTVGQRPDLLPEPAPELFPPSEGTTTPEPKPLPWRRVAGAVVVLVLVVVASIDFISINSTPPKLETTVSAVKIVIWYANPTQSGLVDTLSRKLTENGYHVDIKSDANLVQKHVVNGIEIEYPINNGNDLPETAERVREITRSVIRSDNAYVDYRSARPNLPEEDEERALIIRIARSIVGPQTAH
jgi:hypothetical protein